MLKYKESIFEYIIVMQQLNQDHMLYLIKLLIFIDLVILLLLKNSMFQLLKSFLKLKSTNFSKKHDKLLREWQLIVL